MSRLNLTNLETVCCIARLGTFSAASDRLHATQPAITARVRELENSLGITFFQRRGRRMELTVEGRQFIDRVEPLVGQIENAVLQHSDPSSAVGIVRIGVGAVTMTWFPRLVGQLKHEMPDVHYELDVDLGMNMVEKLESGKLDLAIVAGKVRIPSMTSLDLTPSDLQWVVSRDVQRVVDSKELTTAELLDRTPLWFVSRPSILFPRAVATARKHGAQLHNINTCGSMAGLLDLINNGAGVGLVATQLAKQHIASGSLIPLTEMKPEMLELTLLFHKDQTQSVVRKIAERIVEFDLARNGSASAEAPRMRRRAK